MGTVHGMRKGEFQEMTYYEYGMRLRGFSPGAQPMKGLLAAHPVQYVQYPRGYGKRKYWSVLTYNRQLTDKEMQNYELDFIREKEDY